ncbi:RNA polymerase sigma factor [Streptomyces bottropensis]|uniref:RNA polymerase sigma factor n=1 Tax=Streptomyces bottropensis TaxID=42235 RepID=UPI00368B51A9
MRQDPQASERGKQRKGTRRTSVPKQLTVEQSIGGFNEELLPPESREQWKQVVGLRTECLFRAYRYVSWDTREDVWQETKLSVWRRLQQGPVDDVAAYVRTTCRNEALAHLKKIKARAEKFIDNSEELERIAPVIDESTDARIRELLATFRPELTVHEARIFVLRVGLKWSVKTVAQAMDITEDAVKSANLSARKKLANPVIQNAVHRRLNPE